MRLLHARTKRLEYFNAAPPAYAILSHTWGDGEITFEDFRQPDRPPSSRKIDGCCEQALQYGLVYVWIDTCCIDKSSSAELSEAMWVPRSARAGSGRLA